MKAIPGALFIDGNAAALRLKRATVLLLKYFTMSHYMLIVYFLKTKWSMDQYRWLKHSFIKCAKYKFIAFISERKSQDISIVLLISTHFW